MSRKSENWLLVEWTDGGQNVVYVKSVLSPDVKELKIGESITVNWQGEPKKAVLKERSCNRDELEAKTKVNQPGPSSEAGSNEEGEGFSASGSSWVPSDDGALSNDSFTEKPPKKVKLEKSKRQYVNRRTSKRVIIPSHRATPVIPKTMLNHETNSKMNDSGRKRTHNETVRNNSFNKTAPDSTIVPQKHKRKSNGKKRCNLDIKELQEIGDTFRSLFQMIREFKKPYLNSTPNISTPNIGQNLYQNTCHPNVSYPYVGKKLYQNTSCLNASYPYIGNKKVYQNTTNPHVVSNPNISKNFYQNPSNSHLPIPNMDKLSYTVTPNSQIPNPNIDHLSYPIASNSANNLNASQFYEIPIAQQELIVDAVDPVEEGEEPAEYENEEFNRSDDNVLITNKYENKQYSRKQSEDNNQTSRKPVAGPSKEVEWVAIGSGKTLIPADQFRRVNWKSYTVATRTLLLAVFPRKVLATHSLTGKKSPAFQDKPAKMCLDPKIISDVIMEIQDRFDVKENLIRSIITTKCADECKMLKMRRNRKAAKKEKGNRENQPPNVKFEEDKKGKSN